MQRHSLSLAPFCSLPVSQSLFALRKKLRKACGGGRCHTRNGLSAEAKSFLTKKFRFFQSVAKWKVRCAKHLLRYFIVVLFTRPVKAVHRAVFYSIGLRSLYVDRGQVFSIRTTLGNKINGISAGPVLSIQLLKTPLEQKCKSVRDTSLASTLHY